MNYSFGLLKSDCLERGIEKSVLGIISSRGLEVLVTKRVRLTQQEIDIIYESSMAEDFYEEMSRDFLSGDCIVFIVRGINAIDTLNTIVGHREPNIAEKNTIRHQFGQSVRRNVIHSTATEEDFWKEVLLFFGKAELKQRSVISK